MLVICPDFRELHAVGLFVDRIFPCCCDKVMTDKLMQRERRDSVGRATSRVVEIGIGTGLNLPFYDSENVTGVIGIEPAPGMLCRARRRAAEVPFTVDFHQAGA